MVEFVIDVLTHDLIAEKFRRSCPRMRQQRFLLREFQLEYVMQELSEFVFDFLGFFLWTTDYVSSGSSSRKTSSESSTEDT